VEGSCLPQVQANLLLRLFKQATPLSLSGMWRTDAARSTRLRRESYSSLTYGVSSAIGGRASVEGRGAMTGKEFVNSLAKGKSDIYDIQETFNALSSFRSMNPRLRVVPIQ
jgi:hypothetical protein